MHKSACFVAFIVGAAAGGAASWYYAKKKYESIAQEEIDSVLAVYSNRKIATEPDDIDDEPVDQTASTANSSQDWRADEYNHYTNLVTSTGYTDYSGPSQVELPLVEAEPTIEKKRMGEEMPYVIAPDEAGELDYEVISLTYYADNILADDLDELVEDVDRVIGFESLLTFGRYEEDSVYVRNDRLKADYEILMDERNYSDVLKTKPTKRGY